VLVPHFWREFPSDHIPKASNDVNIHLSIYSCNLYKLYPRISGIL